MLFVNQSSRLHVHPLVNGTLVITPLSVRPVSPPVAGPTTTRPSSTSDVSTHFVFITLGIRRGKTYVKGHVRTPSPTFCVVTLISDGIPSHEVFSVSIVVKTTVLSG